MNKSTNSSNLSFLAKKKGATTKKYAQLQPAC